jgi:hypothetical protein
MHTDPKVHEGEVLDSMPAVRESAMAIAPSANPFLRMAEAALTTGKVEQLDKLLDLQERWESGEARKEYVAAMAAFKAEPMEILKRKLVEFKTRDGDVTSYRHAELADVTDAVVPAMGKHGLSHRWDVKQDGGNITVSCIVTHARGHSESISMTAQPDTSGKKNAIQQVASAVTYLQRYTLLAMTGMATKGMDDDAQAFGQPETEFITEEQEIVLRDLMDAYVNNKPKFLSWVSQAAGFDVTKLCEIPATAFDIVHNQLKSLAKEKTNA